MNRQTDGQIHRQTEGRRWWYVCLSQLKIPSSIWIVDPPNQVKAEAELRGWQGFQGWAQIWSHAEKKTSFPETREHARVPVRKIGSRDSIFHLVNSTYIFKITKHNQHAFNIKYLANLIKKYWTCFRYQKLADFLVCFPPSVCVQVRWPPSWKICLRT